MRRGYSMPLVLMVLFTLSLALLAMTEALAASSKATGSVLGRRKSLYACDGLTNTLEIRAREHFAQKKDPSVIRQSLCGLSATPDTCPDANSWFAGYTLVPGAVEISTVGAPDIVGPVSGGAFTGLQAKRNTIRIAVEMLHDASGRRCRVSKRVSMSRIGLFQFAVFSAMDADLIDAPEMSIKGHTHINGSFCAASGSASSSDLRFDQLTASGDVTSGCFGTASGTGFQVKDAETSSTFRTISSSNDSTQSGWFSRALNRWHGGLKDRAHDVPHMQLPVPTTNKVQRSSNEAGAVRSNAGTLRFLVDPPRDDVAAIEKERFADKADIRIINGMWFKKTATDPWPGQLIWSDHGASYTSDADERALNVPDTVTRPGDARGYSRYDDETAPHGNDNSYPSVVSYGALDFTTNHARQGFTDGREVRDPTGGSGHVLPLNFNVGAFAQILSSPSNAANEAHELHRHFSVNGTAPPAFNGIIWITSTWPGVHKGYESNIFPDAANDDSMFASGLFHKAPRAMCRDAVECAGAPRISAVRVHNAQTLSKAVFPKGLTIATNLPIYSIGNVNTGSLSSSQFVPLLLAGDSYTMLSSNWNDNDPERRLGRTSNFNACSSNAGNTHVVAAILAGHTASTATLDGGGLQNFPRYLECWRTSLGLHTESRITGSLVVGFGAVYARDKFNNGFSITNGVYRPPERKWVFDENFQDPDKQPPGTPEFFLSAAQRWDRD